MRRKFCLFITMFIVISVFHSGVGHAKIRGDVTGDAWIDISDAVAGLRVLAGISSAPAEVEADVDGDGKIGMPEIIFVLDVVSENRACMAFVSADAGGTYVYTESTGELAYTIVESNFPTDNGPQVGSETVHVTMIDAGTMQFSNGQLWHRLSGDPGKIGGEWRGEDDGNETYRLTFTDDGVLLIRFNGIGGVGYAGLGFHNSPSTAAIYVQISRAETDITRVVAELSGPDAVYSDISLRYYADRVEWGASPYVMPAYPTGGIWWLSGIDVTYADLSRASYSAQSPYSGYAYEVYGADGLRADGIVPATQVAQDYVPEPGSQYYYIETFPNGSTADIRTDPALKIFRSGDLEHWFAWNDDGGRSDLSAGILVPMVSGNTYYICVEDPYKNGGYYSFKISKTGFDGTSSGTVGNPDPYEPDDTPGNATPIQVNAVQDHSLAVGERDWYRFVAP